MQTWESVTEAMKKEGWSRRKVERLRREGVLEATKEGRNVRLRFFEYGVDCMTEDEWVASQLGCLGM